MAVKHRYLTFMAAAFAVSLVFAGGAQGEEPPPELKLRFTVFSTEPPRVLAFLVEAKPLPKYVPLVFFPSSRSPTYEYAGPNPLRFFDAETKAEVASINVPPEMEEPLFVLIPGAGSSTRFRVYVHDDAKSRHGAGGLAVLNFSGLPITGTIDRKRVELNEGYYGPFNVGASAKVRLNTLFNSRTIQTYADSIALGKDGRALLILLPPFRKGSLEVQSRVLLDEIPPKTK